MTRWTLGLGLLLLACGLPACGGDSFDDVGPSPFGGSGGKATGGSSGSPGGSGGTWATGGSSSGGSSSGGSSSGGSSGGGAGGGSGGAAGSGATGTGATGGGSSGPHTVGGTVSGLAGLGLKLHNNGTDEIVIAKDGPFTFPAAISTGQPYLVTVSSQPSSPTQICNVSKASGTMGTVDVNDVTVICSLLDGDGDKVPDVADPFPNDPTKPKVATANVVYPHTSSKLFTMDVLTYVIKEVGAFNGSSYSGQMTDLAVDQWGVLYGVTFGDLFTCDATTATCYKLATLPQSFNGLTMLPPGTHHPYLDTLIAIANSGAWYKVTLSGSGTAQLSQLGGYGGGYTSSGDAFSIEGVGTFASVDKPGVSSDVVVTVDPMNGAAKSEVATLSGYTSVYGLAGWQNDVFGFDATGTVLKIDIKTGAISVLAKTGNAWWGAGVVTRLKAN